MNGHKLASLTAVVIGFSCFLTPVSCVPYQASIDIISVNSLANAQGQSATAGTCVCTYSATIGTSSGSVDLGLATYNPQFCWSAVLNVNNNLSSAVDGNAIGSADPLTAATKNNFEIKDIRLTYLNLDGSVFSPTEVVPLSGLVPASGTTGICVDLCSPNAAVKLHSSPPVELRIQLQFDGALVSGEQLQSSQLDFPISYVKNSCTGLGAGCPGTGTCPQGTVGVEQFPSCTGFFGQDGSGFNCVVPSGDAG